MWKLLVFTITDVTLERKHKVMQIGEDRRSQPRGMYNSKHIALCTVCKLQRLLKWTLNGAGKGMLWRVATSVCVLGCFTALTRGHFLRVWLYILPYTNFGAMWSATNNKIDIGYVLCSRETVIRQCTGKCIKHQKSRAPSRRGQRKGDFV